MEDEFKIGDYVGYYKISGLKPRDIYYNEITKLNDNIKECKKAIKFLEDKRGEKEETCTINASLCAFCDDYVYESTVSIDNDVFVKPPFLYHKIRIFDDKDKNYDNVICNAIFDFDLAIRKTNDRCDKYLKRLSEIEEIIKCKENDCKT